MSGGISIVTVPPILSNMTKMARFMAACHAMASNVQRWLTSSSWACEEMYLYSIFCATSPGMSWFIMMYVQTSHRTAKRNNQCPRSIVIDVE